MSRTAIGDTDLMVSLTIGGTGMNGVDYVAIPAVATLPAGASSVAVPITPIDDTSLEPNETVTLTLRAGSGYIVGIPSSGTVTIVSDDVAPDFTVTALTVPATAGAATTVSVSDTTRNQGTGPSNASVTSFYLSTNATISADDELLGSREVPALAIGISSAGTTSLALPQVTAGSYYIIAKADGPATWTETSEFNNTRASNIRIGPDLTVTSLSGPSIAAPGGLVVVNDTTANQGIGDAAASQTRFYLSSNASWDAADRPLQARTVPPLSTGTGSAGTTSVTIPADIGTGTHYLIAKADADGSVAEGLETNNTRIVTLRVGPDLQVSALTVPARAASGGVIGITDTTKNAGGAAGGGSVTAFYISADFSFDAGDIRLEPARAVAPIAAGGAITATTNVTLPALAAGSWYVVARADDQSSVLETLENNNTRFASIAIGPDLDVITISGPTTATAGASIVVSDTVKNLGRDTAPATVTRFYLSADLSFDPSDVLVGERPVPQLGDGVSNTGPATLAIPTSMSGRLYLLGVADGTGTVSESNEKNNVQVALLTINPPQ